MGTKTLESERRKRIKQLKKKYHKVNFSLVKAVVNSNNIDKIMKRKDGRLMVGTKNQCRNWMLTKFVTRPYAPLTMRDVEVLDVETQEVFLGKLTK